jgi:membrane-associated phospholipid phosphatase
MEQETLPANAISTNPPATTWRAAAKLFLRPQGVTWQMVALAVTIPFYLFIGFMVSGRTLHVPAVWVDDALPLEAGWSLVYLSLFLAALLPVFVVHQQELVRRTVNAFLATWLSAYVIFIAYPTVSSRQTGKVAVDGFSAWLLSAIYGADHRYNCFPSLHVAQCFLAALVCGRVHRGVGAVALVWATLVGISTLYTKQHYLLDAIVGAALGSAAAMFFLRGLPREAIPEDERRLAPLLALWAVATYGVMVAIMWVAYLNGVVVD